MSKVLMKGNEAIAEAAIRAGCLNYFAYPITPQSEVAEYLAWRMPEVGDCCAWGPFQLEVYDVPDRGKLLIELTFATRSSYRTMCASAESHATAYNSYCWRIGGDFLYIPKIMSPIKSSTDSAPVLICSKLLETISDTKKRAWDRTQL